MAVFNLKSAKIFKYRQHSLFLFISASQKRTPKIMQNFSYLSLLLFSIHQVWAITATPNICGAGVQDGKMQGFDDVPRLC